MKQGADYELEKQLIVQCDKIKYIKIYFKVPQIKLLILNKIYREYNLDDIYILLLN